MRRTGPTAVLALVAIAQLIGVLDFSIVNVALPAIQREFSLPPDQLQLVVSAYGLMFGGFLLVGGRAADLFDRRTIFIAGVALFSAASLAGGLAGSVTLLLAARAAQGLGAAFLAPASLALLMSAFPEGEGRNRALGVFGTVASVGFTAGVILGGVLTDLAGWRAVFFVNVPIGAVALISAFRILPPAPAGSSRGRLDLPGAVLGTAAVMALVAALSRLTAPTGLGQAAVLGALAIGLLAAFIAVERVTRHPLVPFDVFRGVNLAVANAVSGIDAAVAATLAFTLTLFVQGALGYSPLLTAAVFLPAGLGGLLGGSVAARVVGGAGLRGAAVGAVATLAVGTAITLTLGLVGSALWTAAGYAVAGIGIVSTFVTTSIAATSGQPRERQGLAAGLLTTSQQVGGAIGVAVAGLIDAGGSVPDYRVSLVVVIALLIGAGALLLARIRRPVAARGALAREDAA